MSPSNVLPATEAEFRILQLTDFHSDQSEYQNERTRADVRAMVSRHQPHFLAVTGDIWCGDGEPAVAPMWMARDLDFLASLGVPWAFTWGNHDYAPDFQGAMARIASSNNYGAPTYTAAGESHVEVRGADGAAAWDLFFVNTRDAWQLPEDLAWLEGHSARLEAIRGHQVPGILFFHIPLGRYQRAIAEGRSQGSALEAVLCWGDEGDRGADMIIDLGNIRACFCGHSHRNDCSFLEKGVRFSYGRSTGYGGYGEDLRKGATLIYLPLTGSALDFETVFGDGTRWHQGFLP